jgi:hypothetical protein
LHARLVRQSRRAALQRFDQAASASRSQSRPKGGRPLDQPEGRHDADGIGNRYIEPVKRSLYGGGL